MTMRFTHLGSAILAAACLACASTADLPEGGDVGRPKTPNGFVSNAQVPGLAIAEARFPSEHARIFGEVERPTNSLSVSRSGSFDLLDEVQIVPILIKVGLPSSSASEADVQLTPEQMAFRLVLQDGTVLRSVAAESAVEDDAKLTALLSAKSLQPGFLKLSGGMKEGFVYFPLTPVDDFEYDDGKLFHTVKKVRRELDLSRSLVTFKLTRGGTSTSFFIGVAR